jgi:hypothetical protein
VGAAIAAGAQSDAHLGHGLQGVAKGPLRGAHVVGQLGLLLLQRLERALRLALKPDLRVWVVAAQGRRRIGRGQTGGVLPVLNKAARGCLEIGGAPRRTCQLSPASLSRASSSAKRWRMPSRASYQGCRCGVKGGRDRGWWKMGFKRPCA